MSTDPTSVFDNTLAEHRVHITLESDATTLMRLLELFALRGVLPLRLSFDAYGGDEGAACLRLAARLGRHDWRALCARARTQVGVIEVWDGVPPGELVIARTAVFAV
jgi:hypothetical protein